MTQQITVNAWADEFSNQRLSPFETRVLAVVAAIGPVGEEWLDEILSGSSSSIRGRIVKSLRQLQEIGLIALTNRGWVVTTDPEMEGAKQS